jgi:hypothetical protein
MRSKHGYLSQAASTLGDDHRSQLSSVTEPVKNVFFPRDHRRREINNLAKSFQAFSCLSESVDYDGKT